MASHAPTFHDQEHLYTHLENYPFSTDTDFQSGLHAILSGPSQAQNPSDLILHARCFYYSRKFNVPVDAEGYREWRARQPEEKLSGLGLEEVLERVREVEGRGGQRDFVPTPEGGTPEKKREGDGPSGMGGGGVVDEQVGDVSSQGGPGHGQTQPGGGQQSGQEEEVKPASFQEIMQMIQTGAPIPGIRDIPDTVLEGQGTQASKGRRQKPWEERKAQAAERDSGLFPDNAKT